MAYIYLESGPESVENDGNYLYFDDHDPVTVQKIFLALRSNSLEGKNLSDPQLREQLESIANDSAIKSIEKRGVRFEGLNRLWKLNKAN